MRHTLLATAISPALLLLAVPAAAQTTVSSNSTTNYRTSTAGDVTISSGVTVSPASGTAVTLDSNNNVTNSGTITFTGVDNAIGIQANTGTSGTISSTGTITVTETADTTDSDGDGDPDTPLARGTGRYGVLVTGGGTFTGNITTTGTITVVGNDSSGVRVNGTLGGNLSEGAVTSVTGTNATGVQFGNVTGNVTIGGTLTATGQNAVGISSDGNVTGALLINGAVQSTGFRSITAGTYTAPDADDLLIGGAGLRVSGNVTGGVRIDDDDTDDANDSAGSVASYGSAPAILIGSATNPITLGSDATFGTGLTVEGVVAGSGVYTGISGTGIQIGGLGAAVNLTGGMLVSGTVTGTGVAANGTGIVLGSGANVPSLTVSGTISGIAGTGSTGTGILISAGANLPTIVNSGSIGGAGVGTLSVAISDLSGTLTSITNNKTIAASQTTGGATLVALDLTHNTSGITYTQATASGSTVSPVTTGAINTGSGADTLDIQSGNVTGAISLGAGNDRLLLSGGAIAGAVDMGTGTDSIAISGTAKLSGAITFGGAGGSLSLAGTSSYIGAIASTSQAFALNVSGGTFGTTNTGTIALTSLNLGSTGTLQVNIDPTAGTQTLYSVSGAATLASGGSVKLNLSHLITGTSTYTIVQAGSLTGGTGLTLSTTTLPFLYTGTLTPNTVTGTLALTLAPKTASQLGLNRSGSAALSAVYAAIRTNTKVESAFLNITQESGFDRSFTSFLPEHAGATYLAASNFSRGVAQVTADPNLPRTQSGHFSMWINEIGSTLSKDQGDTQAYRVQSWGVAGGAEYGLGVAGNLGVSLAWAYDGVKDRSNDNQLDGYQKELGAYWRGSWGGLRLNARAAIGQINYSSLRFLVDPSGASNTALATSSGEWSGTTMAAGAGAAYELSTGRIFLRPSARIDYFRLRESAHQESGGGTAFDLAVDSRTSSATTATYSLAAGYKLGTSKESISRIEIEGGWRNTMSGALGATTASFTGGTRFTLLPDDLKAGGTAKVKLQIGDQEFAFTSEVSAEQEQHATSVGLRIGLRATM